MDSPCQYRGGRLLRNEIGAELVRIRVALDAPAGGACFTCEPPSSLHLTARPGIVHARTCADRNDGTVRMVTTSNARRGQVGNIIEKWGEPDLMDTFDPEAFDVRAFPLMTTGWNFGGRSLPTLIMLQSSDVAKM